MYCFRGGVSMSGYLLGHVMMVKIFKQAAAAVANCRNGDALPVSTWYQLTKFGPWIRGSKMMALSYSVQAPMLRFLKSEQTWLPREAMDWNPGARHFNKTNCYESCMIHF